MRILGLVVAALVAHIGRAQAEEAVQGEPQYKADFGAANMQAAMGLGDANDTDTHTQASGKPDGDLASATDPDDLAAWAIKHEKDSTWGYRVYRTFYPEDDDGSEWNVVLDTFVSIVKDGLTSDAEHDGVQRDPHNVKDKVHFEVINDPSNGLAEAGVDDVRARFVEYVTTEDKSPKMGGFKWDGYYKLNIPGSTPNGMALNQALMIDEGSFNSLLAYNPEQTVYDAEQGETPPYVVAVDGCWNPETFRPSTTWTQNYEGWYKVPVELLMLDFYEVTYESRPMEHFAPHADSPYYMFGMGYADQDQDKGPELTAEEKEAERKKAQSILLPEKED